MKELNLEEDFREFPKGYASFEEVEETMTTNINTVEALIDELESLEGMEEL